MFGFLPFKTDDSNLRIREKLIRKITTLSMVITIIPIIEEIVLGYSILEISPLIFLMVMIILAQILSYRYYKHEVAAVLFGVGVGYVVFPSIFILNGGIMSGAEIYFVVAIFYWVGMFKGIWRIILTGINIFIIAACYYVAFYYPQYLKPMTGEADIYIDSIIAVVLVGVLLGGVAVYQIKTYENERKIALEQRDEIAKFSNNRTDLFASMSHEIRTPINAIIGLNEMILREDNLSEEVENDAVTIDNASKMLLSLVNDIMDFTQIEGQKMEIAPVEYGTENMFAEVVDMIRLRAEDKQLELKVNIDREMPRILYGDDKRLKQVILNLLTNAVKYTRQGTVTLEARADRIDESRCNLTVSVSDTGVGIKSENLDTLFDLFTRIQTAENRTIEGTGLGLSISKRLMDMMGGTISVHSIYTKGSVFTINIEQKIIDDTPLGSSEGISQNRQRRIKYQQLFEAPEARVLVVDDNDMNRAVIQKLLKSTKVVVDVAKSGSECLQKTQMKYYHLILMDYLMPEMNGAVTLMRLRKQENGLCRETPVVMLTGDISFRNDSNYTELGFDAYLEKPIRGEELENTVLKFLPDTVVEYRHQAGNLENNTAVSDFGGFYKRNKRVRITTDCISDLPKELAAKLDIGVMYLYVLLEKGRFKDTLEIDSSNLVKSQAGERNFTAQAAPVLDYEEFFAEQVTYAEEVIHISLGDGIGDSYSNALEASRGFAQVRVIDSKTLSAGMALIVIKAAQMAEKGASVDEICKKIEYMKKHVSARFVIPDAKLYVAYGSVSRVIKKISPVFNLHPVIKVKKGKLVISSVKTGAISDCREKYINRYLRKNRKANHRSIYITHVGVPSGELEKYVKRLQDSNLYESVVVQSVSAATAGFSGNGSIGIAVYLE